MKDNLNIMGVNKRKMIFLYTPFVIGFLYSYSSVLRTLVERWGSDDMYSYGFLIPVISIYLLWTDRKRIINTPSEPNYQVGYLIYISGIVLLIAGKAGSIELAQQLSILVTIAGLVFIIFGYNIFRRVLFPILYLLFMIPGWDIITDRLHPQFQMFSATIGVKLMHWIGIPAHQSGIIIELPNITLRVAKVCSGVNYLIAIIAIGIPMSYLYLRSWWKRVVIVSTALVIAIIFNSIRVAMVGYFAFHGGKVHGPYDLFRTLIISAVGYLVLFAGIWFFGDEADGEKITIKSGMLDDRVSGIKSSISLKSLPALVPAVLIMCAAGIFMHEYHPKVMKLETPLKAFPFTVGAWEGKDLYPFAEQLEKISFDDTVSREYSRSKGPVFGFFLGYFETQYQGKELFNYRTEPIFSRGKKITVTTEEGKEIHARYYLTGEEGKKNLIIYWCDLGGKSAADQFSIAFHTIFQSIFRREKNGALIMISKVLKDENDLKGDIRETEIFLSDIYPFIRKHLRTI